MQNSAVEAYWAHNPEVRGSKPRSAIFQSIVQKVSFLLLEKEVPQPGNRTRVFAATTHCLNH